MSALVDYPRLLFAVSFFVLWLAGLAGTLFLKKLRPLTADDRDDFGVIQGAALTLLIGFTFSMALSRYDQRKNLEEAEANAIGTEYVRAGLLPVPDEARVRTLLKNYLEQRALFYTTREAESLRQIDARTSQLQNELWVAVEAGAGAQPTALSALAVAGMNDVLNSEGYTQAAWWNRIPVTAWLLLELIAIGSNLLFGYSAHRRSALLIVLPLAVSVSFFLIADIDSPRGGFIQVQPQNLLRLAQSLAKS